MTGKDLIEQIYKILLLYEDIFNDKSKIKEKDYLGYLDRLYIFWLGMGECEIFTILKGLYSLGIEAEHQTVKAMVFHIINIIQKKGVCIDAVTNV